MLDVVACKGCVRSHEEMASRCRDECGYNADEVIVHIARVAESSCGGGHDGRDELIGLLEGRFLDVESVCCYS